MATAQNSTVRCEVPVFFATTEGQTRRIAERLVTVIRYQGYTSRAIDVTSPDAAAIDWTHVRAAIVGASLHMRKYQDAARAFVLQNAETLDAVPSAFFSVSLAAASINREEVEAARGIAAAFPRACNWRPMTVVSLAGRLAYTQYNFITRQLMKRIARKEGAPTDTSRDWEFTNWEKVDRLGRTVTGAIDAARAA
jgi:menaquinone-dependent protoporphyrinogen oxidase